MMVRTLPPGMFYELFGAPGCAYASEEFNRLNTPKAEAVCYLAGFDSGGTAVAGLVVGRRGGQWLAPHSAPYTMLLCNKVLSTETIYSFLSEVIDFIGSGLTLTTAPRFVDQAMYERVSIVAANLADKTVFDYNYHYPLERFAEYDKHITAEARRHLRRAMGVGFEFAITDDIDAVYDLIARHHAERGYRMAMTCDEVKSTCAVVPSDFFTLTLDGTLVAACYSQRPAPGVAQLINWGDERRYSIKRPMNMLAYRVLEHYARAGERVYDFGPASTAGIPNVGLCRFKESIGGELSIKHSFRFG